MTRWDTGVVIIVGTWPNAEDTTGRTFVRSAIGGRSGNQGRGNTERMKSISFAWTTLAVKALAKSCTRRDWSPEYAARFHEGLKVLGLNRNYRFGGTPFCMIQLTRDPYRERTGLMTEKDFEDEGLLWMEHQGLLIRGATPRVFFETWKAEDKLVYVVRFSILEIF